MPDALPITVVIPAYNAGQYIGETLASVHTQSAPAGEIVVVDDGSTDDTVAVARRHGARVIEQKNLGVSVARNTGIAGASNPWIALLDADDLWASDKLERQWKAVNADTRMSFAFCDFSQFDEVRVRNASVLHEIHHQFEHVVKVPLGNEAYVCDGPTLRFALLVQNVIQPSALLIRKQTVLDLGGFDKELLACQDYDFVMRLTRAEIGAYVDVPLVRYRRHATATTANVPKSREGLAGVARRAIARPWEYAPEAVDHFARALPSLFLKCGFAHLRYGSPERARLWLERSLRESVTVAGIVLYAAAFVAETNGGMKLRNGLLRLAART